MKTKSKKAKAKAPRKILNPQRTIDAKVALVKQAGGKMEFKGKVWEVRRGKKTTSLTSRELAALPLPRFAKTFRLPLSA